MRRDEPTNARTRTRAEHDDAAEPPSTPADWDPAPQADSVTTAWVWRSRADGDRDVLAIERALEVRVERQPIGVTMRTPGRDIDLVAGFCFAEGIVDDPRDWIAIAHCRDERGRPDPDRVSMTLADGCRQAVLARAAKRARTFPASAACGLCGVQTLAEVARSIEPVTRPVAKPLGAEAIVRLLRALPPEQALFQQTGGVHAAALGTAHGALLAVAEDVGRHNAVDKLIGRLLLRSREQRAESANGDGDLLPREGVVALVSGRAGLEIVQKLVRANVPIVLAVGAASSAAVEFAKEHGQTLAGFCRVGPPPRDDTDAFHATVYTHPNRLRLARTGPRAATRGLSD